MFTKKEQDKLFKIIKAAREIMSDFELLQGLQAGQDDDLRRKVAERIIKQHDDMKKIK